jgi:uncharacterized protein (DUF342 family)
MFINGNLPSEQLVKVMAEMELITEEAVDAAVKVSIGERKMYATVYVTSPSGGGAEITAAKIRQALEAGGVVFGIDDSILEDIAYNLHYEEYIEAAFAKMPLPGTDGSISYKFEKSVCIKPQENEDGIVDYRELGKIRCVLAGTVIAEVTVPTDGETGYDVCGRELSAKPGKRATFSVGVGTALSEAGDFITATIDGVLHYDNGVFSVRRDLNIKSDIDFHTGNIQFMGDINIQGNIGEGFKVTSTGGNITIYGGVFSGAEISAKGNITIKNVVNHATVKSGGSINLTYCEYCNISADGDLTAQTLMVSDVYCGGTLISKGKSGGLIGGKYTIISGAEVSNNVGSPRYPSTEILLGNNSVLEKERKDLVMLIVRRKNEILDISKTIEYLNNKKKEDTKLAPEKEELLGVSVRNRIRMNRDIVNAEKRIAEIEKLLEDHSSLRLSVSGTIFEKTMININAKRYEVVNECNRVAVYLDENEEFRFDNL